jgi:hypothetical protein
MKEAEVVELVDIARKIESYYGKSTGHRVVSRKRKLLYRPVTTDHNIA